MDTIAEMLSHAVEQLLGRMSGPLHIRLLIQPAVSATLATLAGLRDARTGQPPFLWTVLTRKEERQRLLHSVWKDVGTLFLVALALDTLYQAAVLRSFYVLQAVIVAVVLAIVPYTLLRGLVTRLARGYYQRKAAAG